MAIGHALLWTLCFSVEATVKLLEAQQRNVILFLAIDRVPLLGARGRMWLDRPRFPVACGQRRIALARCYVGGTKEKKRRITGKYSRLMGPCCVSHAVVLWCVHRLFWLQSSGQY
jgi:hypothetical protein